MDTKRFYRISELCQIVGLSRSGLYKLIRENRFPRGVKLTARATGWPDDLVQKWVRDRLAGPPK
jgi:prophage regulatory protein